MRSSKKIYKELFSFAKNLIMIYLKRKCKIRFLICKTLQKLTIRQKVKLSLNKGEILIFWRRHFHYFYNLFKEFGVFDNLVLSIESPLTNFFLKYSIYLLLPISNIFNLHLNLSETFEKNWKLFTVHQVPISERDSR